MRDSSVRECPEAFVGDLSSPRAIHTLVLGATTELGAIQGLPVHGTVEVADGRVKIVSLSRSTVLEPATVRLRIEESLQNHVPPVVPGWSVEFGLVVVRELCDSFQIDLFSQERDARFDRERLSRLLTRLQPEGGLRVVQPLAVGAHKNSQLCSFCSVPGEVLVLGREKQICDRCILLAADIVGDAEDENKQVGPIHPDFSCGFCGRQQAAVRQLVTGPRVFICDECTATCVDLLKDKATQLSKTETLIRIQFPHDKRSEDR